MAGVFVQLGDTLATIAAAKTLREEKTPRENDNSVKFINRVFFWYKIAFYDKYSCHYEHLDAYSMAYNINIQE